MIRNLPSFSAFRAFEAASRHQSFKAAADELCVTQPAISHQVKGLETFFGATLFHRNANGVELSRSGADYFSDVRPLLDQLDVSTERIRGVDSATSLAVCTSPAFATRWLLPRMGLFTDAYPEIDLELTTTSDPLQFPGDGVDILIQYGREPAAGFTVDSFLSSARFPVCSPEMLAKGPAIEKPEDLARLPLLRDVVGDDRDAWFTCANSKLPENTRGPRFAHCELTMRASAEGHGVALAYSALINDEIANGTLVKLFDLETPPRVIYLLTCREGSTNHPRIAAFRNWIFAEAAYGASHYHKIAR